MMKWFIIFVLAAGLAISIGLLIAHRKRFGHNARSLAKRVARCHGAARCTAAIALLDHLSRYPASPDAIEAWDDIELPLLQALPDCPPTYKAMLRQGLEACSARCPHRETAKRMMTMRDALEY
jgi:hypothetical protein